MWRCELCTEDLSTQRLEGALDHLRLAHPEAYGDGPQRWPDGELIVDDSAMLTPEDFQA